MSALLSPWRDPLFLRFPIATSLVSMVAFVLFATPLTLVARFDPPSLRRYRIQARRMTSERVLGPSVRRFLVNNALVTVGVTLLWPLLRHTRIHAGPLPSLPTIALELLFFVYLDDALYYAMHRALHGAWLYRHVHAVHHRLYAPWACGAHYMHPIEYGLTAGLMLVGPSLVGAHVVVVYLWVAWRQWEAAEGHSGYAFPWNPGHLFPGYGGTEFHDFHHAKFHGNYAGFLGYLDRRLGTLSKGYAEHLAEKRATAGDA